MAEIQADAYLTTDPRRRTKDVRDELQFYLSIFRETKKLDAKSMIIGGGSRSSINSYDKWYEDHMEKLLKNKEELRATLSSPPLECIW